MIVVTSRESIRFLIKFRFLSISPKRSKIEFHLNVNQTERDKQRKRREIIRKYPKIMDGTLPFYLASRTLGRIEFVIF